MLTSYTNSILPGNYIDIYLSTKETDKALVGKLLENVKILAVKTSEGLNVFEDSTDARTPHVIIFSLPEEYHLLLRKINAINSYSIASAESKFSRIEIIPVPGACAFVNALIASGLSSKEFAFIGFLFHKIKYCYDLYNQNHWHTIFKIPMLCLMSKSLHTKPNP